MSMKRRTLGIILTIAIATGGVAFLALQSAGDVEYYAHVAQVSADPAPWLARKTVQIHGFAHRVPQKGSLEGQTIVYRFELESKGQTIRVVHEGVVPDTFKEEAETVVKGKLDKAPDGALVLTTVGGEQGIMAKCPSKY